MNIHYIQIHMLQIGDGHYNVMNTQITVLFHESSLLLLLKSIACSSQKPAKINLKNKIIQIKCEVFMNECQLIQGPHHVCEWV